ncbi:MAG: Response regulator PleD [Pseudomonadota bacterium]
MARTILIIDDSPDIHALLRVRLRDEGAELIPTADPLQALPLALAHQPDLVLLDVDMPGRSGFEVCKELKAHPETAPIPIIFLSGKLDQATKVAGLDLGAIDYVTKPFDPVELRARVRSGLRIKSLQDQLVALARVDALTGLWNRAYLDSRLAQEIAQARRSGRPLSLVMCDVDHFKRVNDTHGHTTGDAVLRSIGARLLASLRTSDVACRFGGEEFAVILPGIDAAGAAAAAERIRAVIAATPIDTGTLSLTVTASLGYADSDSFASDVDLMPAQLIEHADAALYAAKRAGRNRVCRAEAKTQAG